MSNLVITHPAVPTTMSAKAVNARLKVLRKRIDIAEEALADMWDELRSLYVQGACVGESAAAMARASGRPDVAERVRQVLRDEGAVERISRSQGRKSA
jgi:hypothetical protein